LGADVVGEPLFGVSGAEIREEQVAVRVEDVDVVVAGGECRDGVADGGEDVGAVVEVAGVPTA
jgi:hypothetical protein